MLALPIPALAALGGDVTSVQADQAQMKGSPEDHGNRRLYHPRNHGSGQNRREGIRFPGRQGVCHHLAAVRLSLTCSNCWGRTQIGSCKPRSYSERANRAIGRSISNNLISFSRMADTCARILAELIFLPWCRRALTSTHYNKEERVRSFLVLILIGTLGFLVGCGSSGTPAGVVTFDHAHSQQRIASTPAKA